ncbi:hypothetical protein QO002_002221 [Pararhizobium capsulatum DSM 1112]|uniref:Uncharacterized protein n=1 Tax=Pararhizobium capsulatum DSM 1112 TaxID=1121113 RepID=A0ABU0BPA4_9HYPH|nr:hypothetical protein [Pararhizobium capsulatum]MDQ0320083.1 hypothetical protein [Pararhizobium capsulatum DSM 1112]
MIAPLIVMTILGCDDSVSQCHYISTVRGTWETVAVCDAASQKELPKFTNSNYPVVVAMCETSGEKFADTPAQLQQPVPGNAPLAVPAQSAETSGVASTTATATAQQPDQNLPKRAFAFLSGALPDATKLRDVVTAPVHSIQNGYSWVARRFD